MYSIELNLFHHITLMYMSMDVNFQYDLIIGTWCVLLFSELCVLILLSVYYRFVFCFRSLIANNAYIDICSDAILI